MAKPNITTTSGRSRLPPRREPYYARIGKGQHLGFRKNEIGGTWIAKITQNKARQYLALGNEAEYPEYADALKAALRWFGETTADDAPVAGYTVAMAVKDYLRDIKLRKGETARLGAEWTATKWILPELGGLEVAKLTTRRLKQWRDALVSASDDPETVRKSKDTTNRIYTALRAALNRSFKDGAVSSDSAWRRLEPFRGVGRARDVFLTQEQCRDFLAACPDDLRALVKSALLTGGRTGELRRRKVSDLDVRRGVLHIPDGKTGARDVVLNDEALAHFKELAKDKLPGAYLHVRADGTPWGKSQHTYPMTQAIRRAKMPAGTCFYSLRHTHISQALLAGVQTQVVAENCGTSVAMIEKHYGKFRNEDRRAMLNKVSVL